MPKVPVLVNIPDGWELADKEMRVGKSGEWIWNPDWDRDPEQWNAHIDTAAHYIILRRKLPATVKVELPREDVIHRANNCMSHGFETGSCNTVGFTTCRESAACREALKAEQGT